jgi:hypothetical protein
MDEASFVRCSTAEPFAVVSGVSSGAHTGHDDVDDEFPGARCPIQQPT